MTSHTFSTAEPSAHFSLTTGRPLKEQLVEAYAEKAAGSATAEHLADGSWFAHVPGLKGVWAHGRSEGAALEDIRSVVQDWLALKIVHGDGDIPILGGLDLNGLDMDTEGDA